MKTNEEFIREIYAKHETEKLRKRKLRRTVWIFATTSVFAVALGVVLSHMRSTSPGIETVITTTTEAKDTENSSTTTSDLQSVHTTQGTRPLNVEFNRGKTIAERYPGQIGIGGDGPYRNGYFKHHFELDSHYYNLATLVEETVFDEWCSQFSYDDTSKRSGYERNVYTFVHELNIPRDKFTAYIREHYTDPEDGDYYYLTDEDIAILYEGTKTEAYIHFSWGFVTKVIDKKGVRFYTAGWLAEHTEQEIMDVGITKEQIQTVLNDPGIIEVLASDEIAALREIAGGVASTTTTTTRVEDTRTWWPDTTTSAGALPTEGATTSVYVPDGFAGLTTAG